MRRQGIGSALLSALENRLTPLGLTKLSILVPDGQHDTRVLDRAGFVDRNHLSYYERELPMSEKERSTLNELGGRLLPPDLWTSIAGMQNEKATAGEAAGPATAGSRNCRDLRRGGTAGDCLVWSSGHREDHLRQRPVARPGSTGHLLKCSPLGYQGIPVAWPWSATRDVYENLRARQRGGVYRRGGRDCLPPKR